MLLGLGDSVTDGFGAPKGLSYFARLLDNPPGEFPDMDGINLRAVFFKSLSLLGSTMGSRSELHEILRLVEREVLAPVIHEVLLSATAGRTFLRSSREYDARNASMV